ncbi:MAG: GNAT family N-acetyltransferase [Anaerolineaceae bacterium]|nr:GNAT family N-acetyltransferase [Anaerolineaceae bacterium]
MKLQINHIDELTIREITKWCYEAPYDIYNIGVENLDQLLTFFLDIQNGYYKVERNNQELIAYCCFGLDGQVPGGDYSMDALDIGLGVRPDLTGKGEGGKFVAEVIDHTWKQFRPAALRVTIAEFNRRAQRVWEKNGFLYHSTFKRNLDGKPFVILTKQK